MATPDRHTRRAFLQGRAAVRTAADAAQKWVDSVSSRWGPMSTPSATTLHLHASRRAMACDFEVQYHGADDHESGGEDPTDAMLAALDLVEQLEDQMTIYRDHSEVIAINQRAATEPVEVEPRLCALLQLAARLYRETDGAFDITSGPLSRTWGFFSREGRLPDEAEIQQSLGSVGFDRVELDEVQRTIRFHGDQVEINFNAIGKGYALDRAAELLSEAEVTDYLWHGGRSSVLARGCNRADANKGWSVGLRHPWQPEKYLAEFYLHNRALATAGGATQFFEQDGQRFSHILDPRTGWPVTGVLTATVLAPTASEADALSTAFYVMGPEATASYCTEHSEIGAVLVCGTAVDGPINIHTFGAHEANWIS